MIQFSNEKWKIEIEGIILPPICSICLFPKNIQVLQNSVSAEPFHRPYATSWANASFLLGSYSIQQYTGCLISTSFPAEPHFITNSIPDVYFHKQEISACQLLLAMFSRQLALFGKVPHHAECMSHISFQHPCDQWPFRGGRTDIHACSLTALLSCFVRLIRLLCCASAAASVTFHLFLKGLLFLGAAICLPIMFRLARSPCSSLAPQQTE